MPHIELNGTTDLVAQHIFAFSALRMLIAAVMLLAAGALSAAEASPHSVFDAYSADYPDVRNLLVRDDPSAALKAMQAKHASHENDPDFFYLTGLIALKARDFPAAQSAFERVVLMQPENAGAWMDLAIAATENGQYASATSYFNYIDAEFAPPPPLRAVIAAHRARIALPLLQMRGFNLQAELLVGTDSNANSGLQTNFIPLTVGADRIELPLDASYRARPDTFVQLAAGGNVRQQLAIGALELTMNARQRRYQTERDFSTTELNLAGGLRRSTPAGDLNLGIYASHLTLGGTPLVRTLVALAQLERPVSTCRVGVGIQAEERRYFTLNTLDANLLWAQTGLGCNWKLATTPLGTALIARVGRDSPTGNRAGGQTRHTELTLQVNAPLFAGMTADVSYTFANARDADGYSPLLEMSAPRRIDRRSARFALGKPLGGGAEAVLSLEDTRVLSNLSLFRQSGRVISLGIKKSF